jgi:hypothetical protein
MEDLEGGFHPVWYYDTWMMISRNSYSMIFAKGDNNYYFPAHEISER